MMRRICMFVAAACAVASSPAVGADVVSGHLTTSASSIEAVIEIDEGWHINAHRPRQKFLIPTTLTIDTRSGLRLGDVAYPEPVVRTMAFLDEPLLLYEGTITLRVPVESGPPVGLSTATLRYQACTDTKCLPPKSLVLTEGGAAAGPGGAGAWASLVERFGWPATFASVLLLGLALNLTPCVYPLISVTLAYFGGRTGGDQRRTLWLAAVYVLGICITFSAMGVGAALTGSLFGAALQQPAVLGGIALLMVALALSNFGVYQFRVPTGLMQFAGQAGEGTLGALFMGLTMGIVGAPCIGPMVAALLLFVGAQQSASLGLALFFTLGLGLGLPYLGLAVVAGRLRQLPRGGVWLEWVEWLFGFVLLGIALHFATPLLSETVVRLTWGGLIAVAAIVLGIARPIGGPAVQWTLRVVGLVVAAYGVGSATSPIEPHPIQWVPYSDGRLADAQAAGRPVFIDFEAEWCLPCREMDDSTFRDVRVVDISESYVMLKADVTEEDETNEALMRRFEVAGVPTYLLLDAGGEERTRFIGFVEADVMAKAMRETAGRG